MKSNERSEEPDCKEAMLGEEGERRGAAAPAQRPMAPQPRAQPEPRRAPPARPGTTLRRQPPLTPSSPGLLPILQPTGAAARRERQGQSPDKGSAGGTRSCGAQPLGKFRLQVSFWLGAGLSRRFLF